MAGDVMGVIPLSQQSLQALRPAADLVRHYESGAWLTGGCVRDVLLGRPTHDFDVVVEKRAIDLARALADETGGSFVLLDAEHQVARTLLRLGDVSVAVDWAELRGGSIEADLRLRDLTINAVAVPLQDAVDCAGLAGELLIDPLDGLDALRRRQLHPCSEDLFRADPLRVLRAVRLAAELSFAISPELHTLLQRDGLLVTHSAAERVREELVRLLLTPHSAVFLRYLDQLHVLTALIPELEPARGVTQPIVHFLDVLEHLLEAVAVADWMLSQLDAIPSESPPVPSSAVAGDPYPPAFFVMPEALRHVPDLAFRLPYREHLLDHFNAPLASGHPRRAIWKLAVLLHDIAKPQTKQPKAGGGVSFYGHQTIGAEIAASVAERLRFSRHEVSYIATVVREHMRPGQLADIEELSRRAIYRFFRDTGDAGIDTLLHSHADHMATSGPRMTRAAWEAHLQWTAAMLHVLYEEQEVVHPRRLIDGRALMEALGLAPGPEIGRLLRLIAEAQAAGEVRTAEEALSLARDLHQSRSTEV